uniref:Thioredoxin domain-containing protein n=1 Tax=Helicotheca tamesis TaxID=374047 RepID=A0A7S2H5A6_9STRA|mmetsp:Transcript_15351/g.21003  ORF Transcript_15351/g.21003 Transcript_15351/m.21003 type:complete len:162 (+) Transcript_15351:129-614(+)|eukprot:CAMPEP_0185729304 /NCGR_PEP_ID=MMETSP1171-20130828/5084_1 /TAXON_ID=374046 /ORGANISM="Helicotheca tamensis, Strain CCMP826" /LENGTH=161 /DNA_ID=CAMNT_0028398105 /DNA_START=69 /DNA_END=554 /DNA_ORIENTATION=-
MKVCALSLFVAAVSAFMGTDAFVPSPSVPRAFVGCQQHVAPSSTSLSMAKYNTMDEILAKFPEDKPILINFYDASTEDDIKADIQRAKQLLADRCTVVSIRQQDYPEIAKLWDAIEKSPSFILFNDGKPILRFYEETHYLEITAKVGQYCRPEGEEHKAHK